MNRTRLTAHSIAAVGQYKLRSAFIILGTLIGAAALTLVISAGGGVKRKMLSTVRQLFGASSIMVMSGGTQFMGGPGANAARLTLDDIEAVASEVPEIEAWDPQQAMPNASVRYNGRTATARVFGASERFERVWQRGMTRVLRARHAIPNGRPNDFNVLSSVMVQTMLGRMQRVVSIYLPLAAGVILLVAAIVAASLMLASVNARVGEIGLRRAVGARVEDIQFQFIVEP